MPAIDNNSPAYRKPLAGALLLAVIAIVALGA